jgi:hypothetical protein
MVPATAAAMHARGIPLLGGRARSDYPALLDLFSDANQFPTTYNAWLERAKRIEWQFQKAGFGISKTWIRPIPFAAWCDERNISPDAPVIAFSPRQADCRPKALGELSTI